MHCDIVKCFEKIIVKNGNLLLMIEAKELKVFVATKEKKRFKSKGDVKLRCSAEKFLFRYCIGGTWPQMGRRNRVCVVVLGDIGRSPRMQYHALSLARQVLFYLCACFFCVCIQSNL